MGLPAALTDSAVQTAPTFLENHLGDLYIKPELAMQKKYCSTIFKKWGGGGHFDILNTCNIINLNVIFNSWVLTLTLAQKGW